MRKKLEQKEGLLGYLFLTPSLLAFGVFMFYPMVYTIYLSFFDWNMVKPTKTFVGLANYIALFTKRFLWIGLNLRHYQNLK